MEDFNKEHEYDYAVEHARDKKQPDSKPLIAGILLFLAGFISIVFSLFLFIVDPTTIGVNSSQFEGVNITTSDIKLGLNFCSTIILISTIFQIFGGIFSIQKNYGDSVWLVVS